MEDLKLSDKLKMLRVKNNLTQEEVGKRIGVNKSTIMRWEKGETQKITLPVIAALANIYNVKPTFLIDSENNTLPLEFIKPKPKQSKSGVKIPVLGSVAAGIPIDAIEDIIDYEEISEEMAKTGEFFALQIKGDSMEPKFSKGDVVIVRKQPDVESGQIAVVLVNDHEATVKKFVKHEEGISLLSTNPAYTPMFFTPGEVKSLPISILGKVVELRAKF